MDSSCAMRNTDIFNGTSTPDLSELDIIEEFIKMESTELRSSHTGFNLPGPPTPPADLLPQSHRLNVPDGPRVRQSSSSPPQPVLVPRGSAPRVPCSFPQQPSPSHVPDMSSTHPGLEAPSMGSAQRGHGPLGSSKGCGSRSSQLHSDTHLLEKPRLVVAEEPKERGMRFRYECEGRSAGSILGASSTDTKKTLPTIEIQGPIERLKKVALTVSLVTKDLPHRPHPHCLVGKDCPEGSGICSVSFNPHIDRRHSFANLGIQCVRRKELDASLEKRRSQNIDPFRTGLSKSIEDMDMNVVRLCFQCDLEWDDGRKDSLKPIVSNPIYDKKATTTSELKITRLNQEEGPCTGKTEIYMLCDKVQKDDIEIIFKRGSWEAKGEFAQTDVHRQIAIVFKSPPYQDMDISERVEVDVHLRRLSDRMDSEPVTFTYLPHNPDPYEVKRKRKIKKDNFSERACMAAQSPPRAPLPPSQPLCYPQTGSMQALQDRLPTMQPGSSTQEDINYSTPQHTNLPMSYEIEQELIRQLLDNQVIQSICLDADIISEMMSSSFDAGVSDTSQPFGDVDLNFNPSFGDFSQDFSKFNDQQFNQMVNENQTPQTESLSQDGTSHLMEVKKEEEEDEQGL